MTDQQLNDLLQFYIENFNLRNWDIGVRFLSSAQLAEPATLGQCQAQLCDHTAQIDILDPAERDHDVEIALVHECLHVLFCGGEPENDNTIHRQLYENGLDRTAYATVALRREQRLPIKIHEDSLIWAAGLFEGEGSITLITSEGRKYPRLQLSMTDYDVVLRFYYSVGGLGKVAGPFTRALYPKRKPIWRWHVDGYKVVHELLAYFLPWFGVRRKKRAVEISGLCERRLKQQEDKRTKICKVDGCEKKPHCHDMCNMHYKRLYKQRKSAPSSS